MPAGQTCLGVCEVENRHVLEQLAAALAQTGRQYGIVHADTSDERGIDVAFLYDTAVFQVNPAEVFGTTSSSERPPATSCRWLPRPARSAADLRRQPLALPARRPVRERALPDHRGRDAGRRSERIVQIHGKDVAVVAMGDFNDEPFDRALLQHARSERSRTKVTRATSPSLLNLMWPVIGLLQGTHYHENRPGVLDQILVSKGLLTGRSGYSVRDESTTVVIYPDMVKAGQYPQPRRHGRPSCPAAFDPAGFSDHFPVVAVLNPT